MTPVTRKPAKPAKWVPTEREILECAVRAYLEKHRPSLWNKSTLAALSKRFGIDPREFSLIGTYSKHCSHQFSKGPCPDCPHSVYSPEQVAAPSPLLPLPPPTRKPRKLAASARAASARAASARATPALSPRRKMLATKHGKLSAKHFAEWYGKNPEHFLKGSDSVPEMSAAMAVATLGTSRDKHTAKQQRALAARAAQAECKKLLARTR